VFDSSSDEEGSTSNCAGRITGQGGVRTRVPNGVLDLAITPLQPDMPEKLCAPPRQKLVDDHHEELRARHCAVEPRARLGGVLWTAHLVEAHDNGDEPLKPVEVVHRVHLKEEGSC